MKKKINVNCLNSFISFEFSCYILFFFAIEKKTTILSHEDEKLPFENYRTMDKIANNSLLRNNNYTNVNRLSDDEAGHDADVDEAENDDDKQSKRKSIESKLLQQSRPLNFIGDSRSSKIPVTILNDISVRSNPNSSTILMMMKENGEREENLGENRMRTTRFDQSHNEHRNVMSSSIVQPKSSCSSSSSSSLPLDEHQQIKPRKYNIVSTPFYRAHLTAKSTEQLNRSYTNDNPGNYSTSLNVTSFRSSTKKDSPLSIFKQSFLQKYVPSTIMQSASKKMHARRMFCMQLTFN